jgi:hypothetical protein
MPEPLLPSSTAAAAAAAMLLELYGDEWLVLPAMHYRWSFPEQRERLLYQFGRWGRGGAGQGWQVTRTHICVVARVSPFYPFTALL